jgi:Kef-type K+ transport system membrane component KefB
MTAFWIIAWFIAGFFSVKLARRANGSLLESSEGFIFLCGPLFGVVLGVAYLTQIIGSVLKRF